MPKLSISVRKAFSLATWSGAPYTETRWGGESVPGLSSQGIFLSYRREDAAPYARLLQYFFSDRIPDVHVFMDLDSIEAGVDFAEAIREAIDSCAVLVALIGRQWATLADEEGHRRIDNPDDFVRFEVQAALERGVRLIPVLVDGARPLRQQQLPSELQKLARLNALELSYSRYQYDADRLLDLIRRVLAPVGERPEPEAMVNYEVMVRPEPVTMVNYNFADKPDLKGGLEAELETPVEADRQALGETGSNARTDTGAEAREAPEDSPRPRQEKSVESLEHEIIDVRVSRGVLWVGAEAYPLQNIARVKMITLAPNRRASLRRYLNPRLNVKLSAQITFYGLSIETMGTPRTVLLSPDENMIMNLTRSITDAIYNPTAEFVYQIENFLAG